MDYNNAIFKTNNCGELVITEYTNSKKVHVRFVSSGYETVANFFQIKKGDVRDRSLPSVFNVGILGDEPTEVGNVRLQEYVLWKNMLSRCYGKNTHKTRSTYLNCEVSDSFKYYPYFKEWCRNQIGFNSQDEKGKPFHLDKDILLKGNKVYSENTCVFVPAEINTLVLKCDKARGEYLLGVCYHKRDKKIVSKLSVNKRTIHLGNFDTELEAFQAYKAAKEAYVKELANKWKDQIDPRVYEVLMNYQVELTD